MPQIEKLRLTGRVDVVIGSDVTYSPGHGDLVAHVIAELLCSKGRAYLAVDLLHDVLFQIHS